MIETIRIIKGFKKDCIFIWNITDNIFLNIFVGIPIFTIWITIILLACILTDFRKVIQTIFNFAKSKGT